MPIVSNLRISSDVRLGLWRIEETASQILSLYPRLDFILSDYKAGHSQQEKSSVYALLYAMMEVDNLRIDHEKSGKPILEGYHISISDTRNYVAVIVSKTRNVAIDVEYFSNRVDRVVSRFLRDDEKAPDTVSRLIHWCAKETVFKYFSAHRLSYREMRVFPFESHRKGIIQVENLKTGLVLDVHYSVNDDYVLTFAF